MSTSQPHSTHLHTQSPAHHSTCPPHTTPGWVLSSGSPYYSCTCTPHPCSGCCGKNASSHSSPRAGLHDHTLQVLYRQAHLHSTALPYTSAPCSPPGCSPAGRRRSRSSWRSLQSHQQDHQARMDSHNNTLLKSIQLSFFSESIKI